MRNKRALRASPLRPFVIHQATVLVYARSPDVGSTAWRMWKDGRLTRPSDDPALYGLPNEKENAA